VIWDTLRLIGWRDTYGCPGRLFGTISAQEPAHVVKRG
jgi:hypothetical protein